MFTRPRSVRCDHCTPARFTSPPLFFAVVFSVLIEMIKRQENQGGSLEITDNERPKDGVLSLKYWT
jgi:hypothetical protein